MPLLSILTWHILSVRQQTSYEAAEKENILWQYEEVNRNWTVAITFGDEVNKYLSSASIMEKGENIVQGELKKM